MDLRITCVTKSDDADTSYITNIGGPQPPGTTPPGDWNITVDQAIDYIRRREHTFFVLDRWGNRAEVDVVDATPHRRAYIRTRRDGTRTDNLLSLPACR